MKKIRLLTKTLVLMLSFILIAETTHAFADTRSDLYIDYQYEVSEDFKDRFGVLELAFQDMSKYSGGGIFSGAHNEYWTIDGYRGIDKSIPHYTRNICPFYIEGVSECNLGDTVTFKLKSRKGYPSIKSYLKKGYHIDWAIYVDSRVSSSNIEHIASGFTMPVISYYSVGGDIRSTSWDLYDRGSGIWINHEPEYRSDWDSDGNPDLDLVEGTVKDNTFTFTFDKRYLQSGYPTDPLRNGNFYVVAQIVMNDKDWGNFRRVTDENRIFDSPIHALKINVPYEDNIVDENNELAPSKTLEIVP